MMRLVEVIRGAWNCLVKDSPDDPLEWLQSQEQKSQKSTEQIRERRIRETERAFLREDDFLDSDLFSTQKRKGKRL